MLEKETFSYWKKPRNKWMVLSGVILLSLSLLFQVQDFITISNIRLSTEIFSRSGWEIYQLQQHFQFMVRGFLIGLLLGCLVIGNFAKSSKTARASEGILMIGLAFLWGILGLWIGISNDTTALVVWIILLIATLIGGIYSFWKSRSL